jgi:hypothetical protein
MMPYRQGDADSVPNEYSPYREIIESVYIAKGDVGFLTIDESIVMEGKPHRGDRAKFGRALHTEAGKFPGGLRWGGSPWGGKPTVTLRPDVRILLSNNISGSCAVWDAEHADTSLDGDIGYAAEQYPYSSATFIGAGEVHEIGILTPHESLPVKRTTTRQFLRIISSGVTGREEYFTINPRFQP